MPTDKSQGLQTREARDVEGGEMELVPHMDLTGIHAIVIELHER
jgi:hypothetical protein